jgi:hypothetical protein
VTQILSARLPKRVSLALSALSECFRFVEL